MVLHVDKFYQTAVRVQMATQDSIYNTYQVRVKEMALVDLRKGRRGKDRYKAEEKMGAWRGGAGEEGRMQKMRK